MVIKNLVQDKMGLKVTFIILGFFLYIALYTLNPQQVQSLRFGIMLHSPFAILQGVAMYFLGYTCYAIILNNRFSKYTTRIFCALFIILSIFLIYQLNKDADFINNNKYSVVIKFVTPYLFMGLLYTVKRPLSRNSILLKLGELSLPIYIISTLLCTVFYLIFNRINAISPLYGVIAQILITIASYYLALLIYKIPIIRKKFFPRSKEELFKL